MRTLDKIEKSVSLWLYRPVNLDTHSIFWNAKHVAMQAVLLDIQSKITDWWTPDSNDIHSIKSVMTPEVILSLSDESKFPNWKINPYKLIENELFRTINVKIGDIDFSKPLYKNIFYLIMNLEESVITKDDEETNRIANQFKFSLLTEAEELNNDDTLRLYIFEGEAKWMNVLMGKIYLLRKKIMLQREIDNEWDEVRSKLPKTGD